jgi:hypothetical protein
VTEDDRPAHIFLVTSGWDGPFQFEQVLVGADDREGARVEAERAFARVAQPVCRAKMRIADLGPARQGVIAGPARSGEPLSDGGPSTARCGPGPDRRGSVGGRAVQTPGP